MPAIAAVLGALAGHALRRLTPRLAHVKAKGLPFRGPWLELCTAGALACVAAVDPRPGWYLLALLLAAITATDFFCKLIPNRITFPGIALGVLSCAVFPQAVEQLLHQRAWGPGWLLGLMGAAVGFCLLEGFRRGVGKIVGMEVMGMGDSKLLAMIGAFLGPKACLLSVAPGLLAGIVLGVPYTKLARTPHLPFGPALALGGFVTMLFGEKILGAWVGFSRTMQRLPPNITLLIALVLMGIAIALLFRVRKRRAEYTQQIEDEYDRLEERD